MEPKTFEEILREKMQQPVTVKGKDVSIMPTEAMVMSVMNNAMKGEIGAILFIRALTETGGGYKFSKSAGARVHPETYH